MKSVSIAPVLSPLGRNLLSATLNASYAKAEATRGLYRRHSNLPICLRHRVKKYWHYGSWFHREFDLDQRAGERSESAHSTATSWTHLYVARPLGEQPFVTRRVGNATR